mmetsp:Transcript_33746/g.81817  ORF Transcript_33746/g.81817 Transcript_33746/m.81817 type:complete len:138 (+) Transcript_33746:236-649(+)
MVASTIYDMSMLMIADAIIDTFSPSSDKDKIQVEPAATTELQTIPLVTDDENDDLDLDLDLDPIPIDSMLADDEGEEALVSFAASLDYCFLNNKANQENLPTMDPNCDAETIQTSNKKSHNSTKSLHKQQQQQQQRW